jgi:hypothetical protein
MVKPFFKRHKLADKDLITFKLSDACVSEAADGDQMAGVLRKAFVEDVTYRGLPQLRALYPDLFFTTFIVSAEDGKRPVILYGGAELKLLQLRYPGLRYPVGHPKAGQPMMGIGRVAPAALQRHKITLGAYDFPSRMGQNRKYAIKLKSGDSDAKFVKTCLKACGVTVDISLGKGRAAANTTRAPMALLELSQQIGEENFKSLLAAMTTAWPGPDNNKGIEVDALTQSFVRGLALYLRRTELPVPQVVEKIEICEWSAYSIRMAAHEKRRKYDWSIPLAICRQLQEVLESVIADEEDSDVEWDFEEGSDND